MTQERLFFEDFRDSLRHAVRALGGFDSVGTALWPAKGDGAGRWLSDCLNSERPAKLDIEEIERIVILARARGIHCAMHAFCDRTGYARPDISPGRTPEQELADEFERQVQEIKNTADKIAALKREIK